MKKLLSVLVSLLASVAVGLAADYAKFDTVTVGSNLNLQASYSNPQPTNWVQATGSASWGVRLGAGAMVYANKMWVLGGSSGPGVYGDIWYSTDGAAWTRSTPVGWGGNGRVGMIALPFNGSMWSGSGTTQLADFDTMYWSTDGVTWNLATSTMTTTPRAFSGSLVYNGVMWMMGGYSIGISSRNDVWYSANGTNWNQATASATWSARTTVGATVFNGKMWLSGGQDNTSTPLNDVYYSTNGTNWTQATASAAWSARYAHVMFSMGSKMYVAGGTGGGGNLHDVWSSSDGATWIQERNADWSVRNRVGSVTNNNMVWVFGGLGGTGPLNDVWNTTISSGTTNAGATGSSDGSFVFSSGVRPAAANAYDLGSAAFPFRKVYSADQEYSFTLAIQDPTNGLVYWMANPFDTRSCTLTRAYVKTHGMTGTVDLVSQHEMDDWYTYSSITNGVAATATGTAQTSFTGSTAITNGMRIGFVPGALSAFAATNILSVDFTISCP